MKIQFSFHTKKYGTITNTKPFTDKEDKTDDEFGGCVVDFEHVPMIQDYNRAANDIWCKQLQWDYPNTTMESVTTKMIE